jgi:hypothetical protein
MPYYPQVPMESTGMQGEIIPSSQWRQMDGFSDMYEYVDLDGYEV